MFIFSPGIPKINNEADSSPLEYPEIQVVPTKNSKSNSIKGSGFIFRTPNGHESEAKKKFGRAAFKVLASVVASREARNDPIPELPDESQISDDEELDLKGTQRVDNRRILSRQSSRQSLVSLGLQSDQGAQKKPRIKKPVQGKTIQNFASVVKLARYKRLLGGCRSSRYSASSRCSSRMTSISDIEEEEYLPDTPRFSATLSPEAQFAMMKGYEDAIISRIKGNTNDKKVLYRVKTPVNQVTATHLADVHRDPETYRRNESSMSSSFRPPYSKKTTPRTSTLNDDDDVFAMDTVIRAKSCDIRTTQQSEMPPRPHSIQEAIYVIPKEKQLKLSSRFQCAMDILDTLKQSQGVPVTSLRTNRYMDNPVADYNAWSQSWSREFKFQYSAHK